MNQEITSARILVIDDNQAIHQDMRKILDAAVGDASSLSDAEADLFGEPVSKAVRIKFQIDSAFQGESGFDMVCRALEENRPYALAFIDMRMPPGWDGVETTARVWERDPDLQVVICTAYSDYSWDNMVEKLGLSDRLLILRKPFDNIEVLQLAHALTEKWRVFRNLKDRLKAVES